MSKKKLSKLVTGARPALNSKVLVGIANRSSSPNQADREAYLVTGDSRLAKACRTLVAIKRDYGRETFEKLVSSVSLHRPSGAEERKKVMPKSAVKKMPDSSEQPSEPLPLEKIDYHAVVQGTVAKVRVIQHYRNLTRQPVEAIYVFPLPAAASVIGCEMKIGERSIEAVLKRRQEARDEYDAAIQDGHHASLMEQERDNIFRINVGGIEPGEEIKVEVEYVQQVPWQDGGGRFTIPTVVAPRFIPGVPVGKQADGWSPDTDQVPDASRITPVVKPEGVSYRANLRVRVAPGFAAELSSPSHGLLVPVSKISKNGKKGEVEIKLDDVATDRDFILTYRSLSVVPEVAVQHLPRTMGESFSLVTIIPAVNAAPTPSDYVFLLDISGSMAGAKLAGLKQVAKKALQRIKDSHPDSRVAVVAFESSTHLLCDLQEINDVQTRAIDDLYDAGGTRLDLGVAEAYRLLERTGDNSRAKVILVVSDGQTDATPTIRPSLGRIVTVGIDSAVNDATLKDLARKTGGTSRFIYPGEDYDRAAEAIAGMLSGPVVRDIKVEASAEAVGLSDVFAGLPASIALRWKGSATLFKLNGVGSQGEVLTWDIDPKSSSSCDFADKVWAREKLRETSEAKKKEEVSLAYGVICEQTSFVAVSEKEVPGKKPERVEIPVNLPHGWDFGSVFGARRVRFASMVSSISSGGLSRRSLVGSSLHSVSNDLNNMHFGSSGADISLSSMSMDSLDFNDGDDEVLETGEMQVFDHRFELDAAEPVDRLIAALIAANNGDVDGAQKAVDSLSLSKKLVLTWSEVDQAKALYFFIRLGEYGVKINPDLIQTLLDSPSSPRPAIVTPDSEAAQAWLALGLIHLGTLTKYAPFLPAGSDGEEYLAWKRAVGERPTTGDWALVP